MTNKSQISIFKFQTSFVKERNVCGILKFRIEVLKKITKDKKQMTNKIQISIFKSQTSFVDGRKV